MTKTILRIEVPLEQVADLFKPLLPEQAKVKPIHAFVNPFSGQLTMDFEVLETSPLEKIPF